MGVATSSTSLASALGIVATESSLDDLGQLLKVSRVVGEGTGRDTLEKLIIAKTKLVHLGTDNCLGVVEFVC